MKVVKRYKIASVALIFGIILSFLCLFYANMISKSFLLEESDQQKGFSHSIGYFVGLPMVDEEFMSILSSFQGNITITDLTIPCGDKETMRLANIIVKIEENPTYTLVEGEYPASTDMGNIVLGINNKESTQLVGDDSYYTVYGKPYKVSGYIKAEKSVIHSYDVDIYYEYSNAELRDKLFAQLEQEGLYICFETNQGVIANQYNSYYQKILAYTKEKGGIVEIDEHPTPITASVSTKDVQSRAYLSYLYSLILIFISVDFWMLCRKREFIIRKIYGYTNFDVFCLILKEIMIHLGIALAIGSMLEVMILVSMHAWGSVDIYTILTELLTILIMSIILTVGMGFVFVQKAKEYSMMALLNERGGFL